MPTAFKDLFQNQRLIVFFISHAVYERANVFFALGDRQYSQAVLAGRLFVNSLHLNHRCTPSALLATELDVVRIQCLCGPIIDFTLLFRSNYCNTTYPSKNFFMTRTVTARPARPHDVINGMFLGQTAWQLAALPQF